TSRYRGIVLLKLIKEEYGVDEDKVKEDLQEVVKHLSELRLPLDKIIAEAGYEPAEEIEKLEFRMGLVAHHIQEIQKELGIPEERLARNYFTGILTRRR
ncbi:MAG TPA: hypothetical protein VE439_09245, partial [Anaerolineae bacterium]|nr:hypothetical protein [Anaerolineae bacterium]